MSFYFKKRKKYKYPHDFGGYIDQQYLPDEISSHIYYVPSENGAEKSITLPKWKQDKIKK